MKLSQVTLDRSIGVPRNETPPGSTTFPPASSSLLSSEKVADRLVASSFQARTSNAGASLPSSQSLTT